MRGGELAGFAVKSLIAVRDRIARAAESAGRDPDWITLIAVSKTHPVSAIQQAYDAGHRDFGESRLQELLPKWEALPKDIRWHFIGTLQSNKAKRAAQLGVVIHTIEGAHQLREIGKGAPPEGLDGLIEVNTTGEHQKSGISPIALDELVSEVLNYPNVRLRGLMTLGHAHRNAEEQRPFFRMLRELNEAMGGTWLSMGMSNDFEVAIQEGSTHVRVGTAIFGERTQA